MTTPDDSQDEIGIRQRLVDATGDEELLFADGFDSCIVGVTLDGKVVYDSDKMIDVQAEEFAKTEPETAYENAIEYLEFNTFCAHFGDKSPIYLKTKTSLVENQ